MSMKFEKFESKPKGEGSSGAYLRLKDGESVNGVFKGDILKFWQVWPKGGDKQIFVEPAPGASPRFKVNIVVHENGEFVAKVFEFTKSISSQLADLQEDYDLSNTKVKITRRGEGTATVYSIIPSKDQPTPSQLKIINSVQLNALSVSTKEPPKELKNYAPSDDSDEVPF